MNLNPYLIYVVDDDEDTQLRLWRAFSMTQPDCLLYEFSTGEELLDHLMNTEDRPHLILVNSLTSTYPETMTRLLAEARKRSAPVVMLGAEKPETSGGRSCQPGAANCMLLPVTHREAVQAVERLRPVWTRPGWSEVSRPAYT